MHAQTLVVHTFWASASSGISPERLLCFQKHVRRVMPEVAAILAVYMWAVLVLQRITLVQLLSNPRLAMEEMLSVAPASGFCTPQERAL